jgi:hypothetical protein
VEEPLSKRRRKVTEKQYEKDTKKKKVPKKEGTSKRQRKMETDTTTKGNQPGKKEEETGRESLPPKGSFSFTARSSCVSCNGIEDLFAVTHRLVSKFRALSKEDWVQKLALPPPSEKVSQEGYIKSLLIDWARDIEAWRTHLTIAGNQFKEFNRQVEREGRKRSVEIWLGFCNDDCFTPSDARNTGQVL